MDTKNKAILNKLAQILHNQQKIIKKLSQQVLDQSQQSVDPLGKLIHEAALAWSTKYKFGAKSNFTAEVDGKNYQVDVILTIADPKKPAPNTPAAQNLNASAKASFTNILNSMFAAATKVPGSQLAGATATFNVSVV